MAIEAQLRAIIENRGHIGIDEMIAIAMSIVPDSYYRSKQPLGEDADFITSPEISQMFGEMIGLWCLDLWHKLDRPNPFNLIELGPGRGLLMRDLLRATKHVAEFHAAARITLVEINRELILHQKNQILPFNIETKWVSSIKDIAAGSSILIANEFFDALPTKQYIKVKKEWREIVLVIDPDDYALKFDRRGVRERLKAQFDLEHINAGDGAILEESSESIEIVQLIASRLTENPGGALIIDYGYDILPSIRQNNQYIATLQAVRQHKFYPILNSLGDADLSTHVDFNALKNAATTRGAKIWGSIDQGSFLTNMGIDFRLRMLQKQNPHLSNILGGQVRRLTSKDQMGKMFKAIAITSDVQIQPIGL